MTLAVDVAGIGTRLAGCCSECPGLARNQAEGIVPRGLYLEAREEPQGAVVCGLNPGNAESDEIAFYRTYGASYATLDEYWRRYGYSFPYFHRTRNLVRDLGYPGTILWTNVAKCERVNTKKRTSFGRHPQAFRLCASKYLLAEVDLCPESWPLVANGRDAFTALSYLYPSRLVIGIPHATGAFPRFSSLLFGDHLRPEVASAFHERTRRRPSDALWLSDVLDG